MHTLPVAKSSQWQTPEIREFLIETTVPIRLACHDVNGFPLVCSLWFCYHDDCLWCVSQDTSYIVKRLQADNKVAFDIGVNTPPYRGIRGQGETTLLRQPSADMLEAMLNRYQIDLSSKLAKWLSGRIDSEYAIRIDIKKISAWDYTPRMSAN
jgi:hypothetical protein